MNIKNLTIALLAIFALQSCDNSDAYFGGNGEDPIEPPSFTRLADIIKFENVPTDSLVFDPSVDSEVEGSFGVKIFLPANSVAGIGTDSTAVEQLFVVLREYPTLTKMGIGNVQTVSDQELLVTGGNFWWKIVDAEGNDYELEANSGVTAEQPIILDMGDYANDATYYEGEVIQAGGQEVLNWTAAPAQESGMDEGGTLYTYFYGLKLGWVNCDALYDYPGDRTQFQVSFDTDETLQETEQMVLFIVDDFPSIVNITTRDGEYFQTYAESIPLGITGTIIGVALDTEGNVLIGSTAVTVEGDDDYQIDLTEGTLADFSNLLNQASN